MLNRKHACSLSKLKLLPLPLDHDGGELCISRPGFLQFLHKKLPAQL